MSATREELDQARLDLEERLLEIADLDADTRPKLAQTWFEPWKMMASGPAAAGVPLGAGGVIGALPTRAASR